MHMSLHLASCNKYQLFAPVNLLDLSGNNTVFFYFVPAHLHNVHTLSVLYIALMFSITLKTGVIFNQFHNVGSLM